MYHDFSLCQFGKEGFGRHQGIGRVDSRTDLAGGHHLGADTHGKPHRIGVGVGNAPFLHAWLGGPVGALEVQIGLAAENLHQQSVGEQLLFAGGFRHLQKGLFDQFLGGDLNIFDLVKIKKIADKYNVLTLIDSTFSTPFNQRPLEFGMDIVLHSATKYLAGHNDILAGAVLGRKELVDKIRNLHKSMGGLIDPHCCYLLLRGLKTFPLRVEKQNEIALKVARFLKAHPRVKKVYYPFLESHPHYKVATEQMTGGSGVVTFEIKGTLNTSKRFLDALKLCYIGPSLGGVETLITNPALVTYYDCTRKRRYELGITDTLFRLAVGIEDVDDIIKDLENGLKR